MGYLGKPNLFKPYVFCYTIYMSPRGFYQGESIHPHFTTPEYIQSEQGQRELATMDRLEKKAEAILTYPGKLAKRVWYRILVWLGYLDDLEKTTYL